MPATPPIGQSTVVMGGLRDVSRTRGAICRRRRRREPADSRDRNAGGSGHLQGFE